MASTIRCDIVSAEAEIFRARATASLSSGESSSIPRMAMMSRSSL